MGSEPTTWATVALAAIGATQTVGMAWLARHFKKNRNLGRQRDALMESAVVRTEAALKEFGSQIQVLARDGWSNSSRIGVVEARCTALEKDVALLQEDVRR